MKKIYIVKHLSDKENSYNGINSVDVYPCHDEAEAIKKVKSLYEGDYKLLMSECEDETENVLGKNELENYYLEDNEFYETGYSINNGADYYSCETEVKDF